MDSVEQWTVLGCQLDLLDNRPVVTLQHSVSGEVFTSSPGVVRQLDVGRSEVYRAGYLHGAADGIAGRVTAASLQQKLVELASANDAIVEKARPHPEMVPGG